METKEFKIPGCTKVNHVLKLDERKLLTTHRGLIKLWKVSKADGSLTLEFVRDFSGCPKNVWSLAALTKGRFASYHQDHIRIWDIETGNYDRILVKEVLFAIHDMVELPGGLLVANRILHNNQFRYFSAINVWDLSSGRLVVEDFRLEHWTDRLFCINGFLVVAPNLCASNQVIRVFKATSKTWTEVFSKIIEMLPNCYW